MNYQETGNQVPISQQELIVFVHSELEKYDYRMAIVKEPSSPNPYIDTLIYKTKDSKTIKVPEEIQKEAIHLWYKRNGTNVPAMQRTPNIPPERLQAPPSNARKAVMYVYEDGYDWVKISILATAALIALYLFFQMNKK